MPYYAANLPTPRIREPKTSDELAARADLLDQLGMGEGFLGDATDAMGEFALAREGLRAWPKKALAKAVGLGGKEDAASKLLGRGSNSALTGNGTSSL